MFLGLIIALCDLRHIYHSEWSPPHHASARATAPTLLRRSLYPNHCRVTSQPPPDARHRPPPRPASPVRLPRPSRAPRPGCDGTIVGKPKSPRAGAVQAHDPFCMQRCLCRDPVVRGGAFRARARAAIVRRGAFAATRCTQRCLCRDPVVGRGAFAATPLYAEAPSRTRDGGGAGIGGRSGSGHRIAAGSTKRWNGAIRFRQPSRISIQPKFCRMTGLPRGRTGPGARPGNARPGCATLWGRRG